MTSNQSRSLHRFAVWSGMALLAGAIVAGAVSDAMAGSTAESRVTHAPASTLKWTTLPNGRQISPVAGDLKTGPHTTFIKFAAGMKTVPHTHSNDYYGIVVKGTARHFEPGRDDSKVVLPAGSHWAVPADVVHVSECLPESECIFAITQKSFFDIKPAQ